MSLVLGAVLVSLFVCVALVSFFWTPYDPKAINVPDRLLPPFSDGYIFGTDKLGRDVVTQLMLGARNSLYVSVMSTTVALTIGALFGLFVAAVGTALARRPHAYRRRRSRPAGHPRRPRPGHQVRPGQQHRDHGDHRVVHPGRGPSDDRAGAADPGARLRRGGVRLRAEQALRPVQPRAAQHRPAPDRAGVGDVRRRHPHRGVVGVPRASASSRPRRRGADSSTRPNRSSTRPRT